MTTNLQKLAAGLVGAALVASGLLAAVSAGAEVMPVREHVVSALLARDDGRRGDDRAFGWGVYPYLYGDDRRADR